jgi:hypothetical protein
LLVDSTGTTGAALAQPGPTVEVAGRSEVANWRTWTIDLPPGHYPVRVSTHGLGSTEILATVHPGQVTTIYYQAPAAPGGAGQLRHTPKVVLSEPQLRILVAIAAVALMLVLSAVIIATVG